MQQKMNSSVADPSRNAKALTLLCTLQYPNRKKFLIVWINNSSTDYEYLKVKCPDPAFKQNPDPGLSLDPDPSKKTF
jgi:hypothetical protein